MAKKYVQCPTLYLAGSGVIIGAVNIVTTTLTDVYGNVLTMTDFGDKGYITLEPDTTNEEPATFTSITANANGTFTLGGVSSLLAKSPYTEASGLVRAHSGGLKVVVTDNVGFWNTFANKNNNETIAGKYTLPGDNVNRPTLGSDVDTATVTDLVTFGQLARQALSGAPNGSTTVKGIFEEATTAEINAGTQVGGTGAELTMNPALFAAGNLAQAGLGDNTDITVGSGNKFVTQTGLQKNAEKTATTTGSANAYIATLTPVPIAIPTGSPLTFIANFSNTGTATLNLNSLGAKAITKLGTTALASGDIVNGNVFTVVYDGTQFQLQSPVATVPLFNKAVAVGTTTYAPGTSSGTQAIPHGLAVPPKLVRLTILIAASTTSGVIGQAFVSYNGTTLAAVYSDFTVNTSPVVSFISVGTSFILGTSGNTQTGTITVDATNINIAWTLAGTGPNSSSLQIMWETIA